MTSDALQVAENPLDVLHLAWKYLDAHKPGSVEVRAIVERCLRANGVEPGAPAARR